MTIIIKILLAGLLIGCLFNVPYGYFQFIRIAGCVGFIYLAYYEFQNKRNITGIFSVACALLLNPVFKIHFVRKQWNIIDVVIAVLLLIWVIFDLYFQYGKGNKKV
jgi:hypothetical protein